jgi:hypothetical protein
MKIQQLERDDIEICQRWQKYLLSISQADDKNVPAKDLQGILQQFLEEKTVDEKSLVQIFYISTGWFPTKIEIQELKFAYSTTGLVAVEDKIKEQYQHFKRRFREINIDLTFFPAGTTFIDISHTLEYPFNTGIQRVVRNISANLLSDSSIEFVKWDLEIGGWVIVEKELVQNQLPFKKNNFHKDYGNANSIARYFRNSKYFSTLVIAAFWYGLFSAYRFLVTSEDYSKIFKKKIFLKLFNLLKRIHKSGNILYKTKSKVIQSPMLIDQQIFFIETTQNSDIVMAHEYFDSIGSLSVLVYDLLPISNPEYFPQASIQGFLMYLKLLSFANKILTISEFTKQQVSKYCELKPNIVLKSEYDVTRIGFSTGPVTVGPIIAAPA